MTNISISQLKANPSAVLSNANDYPVAIKNRNKITGYIIGKDIFEKLVSFVEDNIDRKAIKEANYKKETSLEEVIKELGLE